MHAGGLAQHGVGQRQESAAKKSDDSCDGKEFQRTLRALKSLGVDRYKRTCFSGTRVLASLVLVQKYLRGGAVAHAGR